MTDEELMYAALLALTRQNVTGTGKDDGDYLLGDFNGIYTTGWVEQIPAVYGEFST